MDELDEFYFSESPLLRLCLLSGGRTEHVNQIFAGRDEKGEYQMLFKELWDQPEKFFEYFRMMPSTFEYIFKKIEGHIEKFSNFRECISAKERLAVTLRFLSTGLSFRALSFSYRISHCTIRTIRSIVYETCKAIWECFCNEHMRLPSTDEWKTISSDFYNKWNFPNCIGCIDGKHIRMKCPKQTGSMYYNYKGYFSIVLQGIADANYKFIAVEVGGYGKQSDGGTFSDSNIFKRLESNTLNIPENENLPSTDTSAPFVLLGDDAYPLKTYLLKPYTRQNLTSGERIFNYRLSRARRCVECAFGILVAKWRCLKTELQIDPDKVDIIVKCVCLLHNLIIDKEGLTFPDIAETESEFLTNTSVSRRYNHYGRSANEGRDILKNYFVSPAGEIPFQYNLLN